MANRWDGQPGNILEMGKLNVVDQVTEEYLLTNWWQTSHFGCVSSLKQDLWYGSLPDNENLINRKKISKKNGATPE